MESEKVKEIRQIMIDTNKELEEIFKNSFDKISLQKRRSYLVNKIAAFESDTKSKDMVNVLQKEYEILPPVFDDCNIQTVLDSTDLDEKLGEIVDKVKDTTTDIMEETGVIPNKIEEPEISEQKEVKKRGRKKKVEKGDK